MTTSPSHEIALWICISIRNGIYRQNRGKLAAARMRHTVRSLPAMAT
jgi:hypothetical protein